MTSILSIDIAGIPPISPTGLYRYMLHNCLSYRPGDIKYRFVTRPFFYRTVINVVLITQVIKLFCARTTHRDMRLLFDAS